jgi:hypothetical protein
MYSLSCLIIDPAFFSPDFLFFHPPVCLLVWFQLPICLLQRPLAEDFRALAWEKMSILESSRRAYRFPIRPSSWGSTSLVSNFLFYAEDGKVEEDVLESPYNFTLCPCALVFELLDSYQIPPCNLPTAVLIGMRGFDNSGGWSRTRQGQ